MNTISDTPAPISSTPPKMNKYYSYPAWFVDDKGVLISYYLDYCLDYSSSSYYYYSMIIKLS